MPRSPAHEMACSCLAVRARMLSRAVTAVYERHMHRHGLTVPQGNILIFVATQERCTPGEIGQRLHLERSTVSRNITGLLDAGLLAAETSDAGRVRTLAVARKGERRLRDMLPDWRRAQREASDLLGEDGTEALMRTGNRLLASA